MAVTTFEFVFVIGLVITRIFSTRKEYHFYQELPFSKGPVLENYFLEEVCLLRNLKIMNINPKLDEVFVFANTRLKVYHLYWKISATKLPFRTDDLPTLTKKKIYSDREMVLIKFIKYLTPDDLKLIEFGLIDYYPIWISSNRLKNNIKFLWNYLYKN
jgi:hypothetical protein